MIRFLALLFTTYALLNLPLMAEDKVMKCFPFAGKGWEDYGFEANYYKLEKKLFGNDRVLIRVGTKWKPFCKTKNKTLSSDLIWSQKKKTSYKNIHIEMGDNAVTCFFVSKEKVSDIAYLKSRCKNYESIGEECNTGGFPFNDSYFIYQKFSLTIDFDRSLTEYSSSKFFDEEEKADIRFRKLKIKRKEECN